MGQKRRYRVSNPVLEQVFGEWGLGAIAEVRSGAPYGVVDQTNTSNTFSDGQLPTLLRNPQITGSRSTAQMLHEYFDTTAFVAPAVATFGDAPRNDGIGPGMADIDLSIHKTFPLSGAL